MRFFIHDYETFGLSPNDKVSQFAGIYVDENFEIVGEPEMFYCQVPEDCVPSPAACAITNISPYDTKDGLKENAFAQKIYDLMTKESNLVVSGYNNASFDDEVTRNLFYRNIIPIYDREWANGNSRFDFYQLVKAIFAFKKDSIVFPKDENGIYSLKLENLTKANGLAHESAHDALSDVYATISIGKLIKQKEPKLFDWVFENRIKANMIDTILKNKDKPVWYVDNFEKADNDFLTPMKLFTMPEIKTNSFNGRKIYPTEYYYIDLSASKESLNKLSSYSEEELREWWQMPFQEREEKGIEKCPLVKLKANKMKVIAPFNVLSEKEMENKNLNIQQIKENLSLFEHYFQDENLKKKVLKSSNFIYPEKSDPDQTIYNGFFNEDNGTIKQMFQKIKSVGFKEYAYNFSNNFNFKVEKLNELKFRMIARNEVSALSEEERKKWEDHIVYWLTNEDSPSSMNISNFNKELEEAKNNFPEKIKVLNELEEFFVEKCKKYGVQPQNNKEKKRKLKNN